MVLILEDGGSSSKSLATLSSFFGTYRNDVVSERTKGKLCGFTFEGNEEKGTSPISVVSSGRNVATRSSDVSHMRRA